jgi:uncharacterized protein involved in exopolysaccharide biosynthesis
VNIPSTKTAPTGDISVRSLAAPLFRKKGVLIGVFAAVFALVLTAGLLRPVFKSQMEVLVSRERLDPLVTTESTSQMVTAYTPLTDEEINSESELMLSQDVLQQVVLANGLDQPQGFSLLSLLHPNQTKEDRLAKAIRNLAKKIKVEEVTKTDMIRVSYSSSNPKLSYGVLNSLATFYLEKHVAVHRPAGSYQFFAGETQRYQDALQQSESRLRDFSQQQHIAAPADVVGDLAGQLAIAIGQLHGAQQGIATDEERVSDDQHQMKVTPLRSATLQASAPADKLLEDLNDALLAAQAKRTQLGLKYDPKYPLVQEADQEIAQARAAITAAEKTQYVSQTTDRDPTYELLREDAAKTEADLAGQRAAVSAIQNSIRSLETQMVDLDRKALLEGDLLRDAKANEGNYLLYLSKREQERMTDALDQTRIANVAIASPPVIPVLPLYGTGVTLFFALILGMFFGLSGAYAADYLDSSFHTPADVIDILGIPVVVAIPRSAA